MDKFTQKIVAFNEWKAANCTTSVMLELASAPTLDDGSPLVQHREWWELCATIDPSATIGRYTSVFTLKCDGFESRPMTFDAEAVNGMVIRDWILWLSGFPIVHFHINGSKGE